MFPTVAALLF